MTATSLDFSFDMEGVNRDELLAEAANRLDALASNLGSESRDSKSPAGDLARELQGDVAEFAALPVVHKITDADFITRGLAAPVGLEELTRKHNYYWTYFPIALFPKRGWAFNRLEIALEFNPLERKGDTRPKAHQILPQQKFQTLLKASQSLEIELGENLEFSVKTGVVGGKVGDAEAKADAGVDAKVAAKVGMVAGPFEYKIKRAKIEHTPVGMEKVFWRIDGAEFFQEDETPIIVIARVPKETNNFTVSAAMQAYRYFNFAAADVQDAIRHLPQALKDFFKAGVVLRDQREFDISEAL